MSSRCYMAKILLIRSTTLSNQSTINQHMSKGLFPTKWFFLSRFENRLLRLRNLDLYSVSTAFELEKILSCHTSCETEPWFRHSCPTDGQQIRRLLQQSKKPLLAIKGGISFLSLIRKIDPYGHLLGQAEESYEIFLHGFPREKLVQRNQHERIQISLQQYIIGKKGTLYVSVRSPSVEDGSDKEHPASGIVMVTPF